MSTRRLLVVAASVVALLGLLPAVALADGPDVTGTVVMEDGAPVAGAEVSANIVGLDDQVFSATTDSSGAFALTVGVQSGQSLKVQAKSPTTNTSPDAEDCIYSTTWYGGSAQTVGELPLAPIVVTLDQHVTGTVCGGVSTGWPVTTPPPTDARRPAAVHSDGGLALVAAGLIALMLLAAGPARRPRRRPARSARSDR